MLIATARLGHFNEYRLEVYREYGGYYRMYLEVFHVGNEFEPGHFELIADSTYSESWSDFYRLGVKKHELHQGYLDCHADVIEEWAASNLEIEE